MWTPTTRRQHSRDHLRYGSDLSDAEWEIIAPFMPPPAKTGRPREWTMREIMNAIFYVLRAGCAWRMLPKDFPPMTTVYRLVPALPPRGPVRDHQPPSGHGRSRAGRARGLAFGGGDRQPERQDDRGRRSQRLRRRQEDQGPQAPRHGRHRRTGAGDAGPPGRYPGPRRRGPAAQGFAKVASPSSNSPSPTAPMPPSGSRTPPASPSRSSRKIADQVGFQVLPRRWVVERFFAWINRNRRLAKDFEGTIASAETFLYAASVMLLTRRLARSA